MKIAIAADADQVARHFGHCKGYSLFHVEKNQVKAKESIDNPGHRPDFLPGFLADLGVDSIIAGGMGHRAVQLFEEAGITPIIGVEGLVDDIIEDYLQGKLKPGGNACHH